MSQSNTWTEVENDSRQFSYVPDRRLALLPLQDHRGSAVQTWRVADDGSLSVAATHHFGAYDWMQRAMVTGDDSVVALVASEDGPQLVSLDLKNLSATGTLDL